ncbi:MAG: helix-turn-helix domain-containing protein [Lachnospiraceae bacterium]|nr:helix-turn-helix domain-containing protein [Lachnospiraceae bacterium]
MNLLIYEKSEKLGKEIYATAMKSNLFYQIRCGQSGSLFSKMEDLHPHLIVVAIELIREDIPYRLNRLSAMYPGCAFLVTGGMENYTSLLAALRSGAVSFILRPFAEISIHTALQNAVARILTMPPETSEEIGFEQAESQAELHRIKAEKLLFSMINTDNPSVFLYRDLCSFAPEYNSYHQCRVWILAAEHLPLYSMTEGSGLASSALARLMNNLMMQNHAGVAISGLKSSGEFSLFFFQDLDNSDALCRSICMEVRNLTGLLLHVGLGPVKKFPEEVQASADIARIHAKSFNLLKPSPSTITRCDPRYKTLPYNFSRLEQNLYAALLTGNSSTIRHQAHDFTATIIEQEFLCIRQMERLRLIYHGMRTNWIESFRVLYAEAAQELYSPAFVFRLPYDETGAFSADLFEQYLTDDLMAVSRFILALSAPSRLDKHFLQSVHEYVYKNYTEDLSLKQLAQQFSVSPNYLSSAFKKKYNISLLNYIHELRLTQAKELLGDPSLSIQDVSHAVGFSDAKYFSRLFQKKEGISPREYRKNLLEGTQGL